MLIPAFLFFVFLFFLLYCIFTINIGFQKAQLLGAFLLCYLFSSVTWFALLFGLLSFRLLSFKNFQFNIQL